MPNFIVLVKVLSFLFFLYYIFNTLTRLKVTYKYTIFFFSHVNFTQTFSLILISFFFFFLSLKQYSKTIIMQLIERNLRITYNSLFNQKYNQLLFFFFFSFLFPFFFSSPSINQCCLHRYTVRCSKKIEGENYYYYYYYG